MNPELKILTTGLVMLALAACGGDSDSGAGGSGTTRFTGPWFTDATVNVNIGGTNTPVTEATRFLVGASGNVVIDETDSDCSLEISVNGDIMAYETTCVFTATSGDVSSPCVLTIASRARIRGSPGNAQVSGSFGPETEVCRGSPVSYTGNLIGRQG